MNMHVKRIMSILFILLLGGILIACSDSSNTNNDEDNDRDQETEEENEVTQGGELNIAFSAQPPTLDIHLSTATATRDISQHIFEPLVTLNSSLEVEPMLAESYEISEDGKTITFYLREGIKFHNGEDMTAEDVIASLERWQGQSAQAKTYHSQTVFTAKDDYTVVAEIENPSTLDMYVLADMTQFAAIMPKDVIENVSDDGVEEIVGTGPYALEEWRQDQYIHLKKFADYQSRSEPADGLAGEKKAPIDDMYFHFITDSSTRLAGIQTGEYDIAIDIPHDDATTLEATGDVRNEVFASSMLIIMLNNKEGVFSNQKIRQAANAAINMEDILTASFVNEEYYIKDHALVKEEQAGWYTDAGSDIYHTYDPELAEQLLDEAGYDGEEVVLLTNRDYETHYNTAVIMQSQLEAVGMNVTMDVRDWPTAIEMAEDPSAFDAFYSGFAFRPMPIQQLFLNPEYIGWPESEELQRLSEQILQASSLEEAQSFSEEFHRVYYEEMPALKAGNTTNIVSLRENIDGLQFISGPILWNITKTE